MTPTDLHIEVFADVLCPFTHVGLRRLVDHRLAVGRTDVGLWIRSWPLEVVNGEPLDADFIAEEVDEIREQVAPDLFTGFDKDAFPSSALPALTLARAAYRCSLPVGEAVSLELRNRLFEAGENIGDPSVLDRIAADHGVDIDADDARGVLTDHEEGVRRGVIGSPHFFTADQSFFCPVLQVGRDDAGHLRVVPDREGFAAFLSRCFGT